MTSTNPIPPSDSNHLAHIPQLPSTTEPDAKETTPKPLFPPQETLVNVHSISRAVPINSSQTIDDLPKKTEAIKQLVKEGNALDTEFSLFQNRLQAASAEVEQGVEMEQLTGNIFGPFFRKLSPVRDSIMASLTVADIVTPEPHSQVDQVSDAAVMLQDDLALAATKTRINDFADRVLQAEFAFRIPQTLAEGGGLIYKSKCIDNAKKICNLLSQLIQKELRDHPQIKELKAKRQQLEDQIQHETEALHSHAKSFCVTSLTYIPKATVVIWKLVAKLKPVIKVGLLWATSIASTINDYRSMRDTKKAESSHREFVSGKWGQDVGLVFDSTRAEKAVNAILSYRKEAFTERLEENKKNLLEIVLDKEKLAQLKKTLLKKTNTVKFKTPPSSEPLKIKEKSLITLLHDLEKQVADVRQHFPNRDPKDILYTLSLIFPENFDEFVTKYTHFQETEAIVKRDAIKADLTNITLEKQASMGRSLRFDVNLSTADFYLSLMCTLTLATLTTAALFVSVGALMLFPYITFPTLVALILGASIYYLIRNKPNMTATVLKNSLESIYYPIRQSYAAWRLQTTTIQVLKKQVDLQAASIAVYMKQESSPEIEQYTKELQKLEIVRANLKDKAAHWDDRVALLKLDLVNAELKDLGRAENLESLAKNIHKSFYGNEKLHRNSIAILKDTLGIDLERLGKDPSEKEILHALLQSLFAKGQDELMTFIENYQKKVQTA